MVVTVVLAIVASFQSTTLIRFVNSMMHVMLNVDEPIVPVNGSSFKPCLLPFRQHPIKKEK